MPEDIESLTTEYTIYAPSPAANAELIGLVVAEERIAELATVGRITDLFGLLYNLCGIVPDVNNIGYHERDENIPFADNWGGLKHAHVIFKGLKRPFHEADHDSVVYIYVVSPRYTYKYVPDMVCCARRLLPPQNAVFVAYVIFSNDNFVSGRVINWEWVKADPLKPNMPNDFSNRYDNMVWENG